MNFRKSLYKKRDGQAKGTSVFMGTRFTGFPKKDWYGETNTIGGGSPLNYRGSFMLNKGLTNLLRAGKEDFEIEEGSLHINNRSIEEINDFLNGEGNGDLTLINTGPFNSEIEDKAGGDRESHLNYFELMMDQGMKVVNTPKIAKACGDKRITYSLFEEQKENSLPWYNLDHYLSGPGIAGLKNDFKRFKDKYNFEDGENGDVPVVAKPANGSGGDEILFTTMDSFISGAERKGSIRKLFASEGYNPNGRVLQMSVPAVYDQRIIATDGVIETAETRIGEGDLHNLQGGGRAIPVKRDELQEGAVNMVQDYSKALLQGLGVHENAGSFIGWDALGFDLESEKLDGFPDYKRFLRENVAHEDYAVEHEGQTVYLVPGEANDSPGSKIDGVNSAHPEQNSALALMKFADDLSRGQVHDPYEAEQLAPVYRHIVNDHFRDM
ncbi:hypothetical protein [Candidatus Nanohalococcus occultus]|uniref:hypothetical protein n=1 Tax=Candidatus Nanohalococcus occultus TaxID=2978047 RepID=UPI0039E0A125